MLKQINGDTTRFRSMVSIQCRQGWEWEMLANQVDRFKDLLIILEIKVVLGIIDIFLQVRIYVAKKNVHIEVKHTENNEIKGV